MTDLLDIAVQGMHCEGCARSVERAVGKVPGVTRATVNLAAGLVQVQGGGAAAIAAAIRDAGFTTEAAA